MDRDSVVTKDCFEVLFVSLIDEEEAGGLSSMWTEQVFLQLIQLMKPFMGEDRKEICGEELKEPFPESLAD